MVQCDATELVSLLLWRLQSRRPLIRPCVSGDGERLVTLWQWKAAQYKAVWRYLRSCLYYTRSPRKGEGAGAVQTSATAAASRGQRWARPRASHDRDRRVWGFQGQDVNHRMRPRPVLQWHAGSTAGTCRPAARSLSRLRRDAALGWGIRVLRRDPSLRVAVCRRSVHCSNDRRTAPTGSRPCTPHARPGTCRDAGCGILYYTRSPRSCEGAGRSVETARHQRRRARVRSGTCDTGNAHLRLSMFERRPRQNVHPVPKAQDMRVHVGAPCVGCHGVCTGTEALHPANREARGAAFSVPPCGQVKCCSSSPEARAKVMHSARTMR